MANEVRNFFAHRRAKRGSKPGDEVRVHGVECEVVDDATAETADCVVCIPAAPMLVYFDNETGPCHDCHTQLQWRPHAPRKPIRLCLLCAAARIAAQD